MLKTSETIGKLSLALSKAQGEMQAAIKHKENDYFNSKYAELGHCFEVARGPLSSNELSWIQGAGTFQNHAIITTRLTHSSGEWIEDTLALKPKDMSIHSVKSAISYGRRIGFNSLVGISELDEDDDGNKAVKHDPRKKQQQQQQQQQDFI